MMVRSPSGWTVRIENSPFSSLKRFLFFKTRTPVVLPIPPVILSARRLFARNGTKDARRFSCTPYLLLMKPETIRRAELLLKCLRLTVDEAASSGPPALKAERALDPQTASVVKSPEDIEQPETPKQTLCPD